MDKTQEQARKEICRLEERLPQWVQSMMIPGKPFGRCKLHRRQRHSWLLYASQQMFSLVSITGVIETLDDAAGEAFDKVARLLGLGYPGGPIISKLAEKGNPEAFNFPRPMLDKENKLNFSFSGLKSAVRREVENLNEVNDQIIADLCASFQQAVIETLVDKLVLATQEHEVKEVHLAGGVSANHLLRKMTREKLPDKLPVFWPIEQIFCTDNAAMIATAAYFKK